MDFKPIRFNNSKSQFVITLRKRVDAYFKQNGPQLIEGVVDQQERLLLESLHRSMTEEQQSGDLAFHEPARLRPEAYALLYAGGRYAA